MGGDSCSKGPGFESKHHILDGHFSHSLVVRIVMPGGSPGFVAMGDDLWSRGCGFESRCHILDGHFFTFICCKNCHVCLKRRK